MIVVDTTILVYAVGADHPLLEPCRAVLAAVGAGDVRATTTVEVIQEFAHVRARRRDRRDAAALARSYADFFAPLLTVERDDLVEGLGLFERSTKLGAFDAVLAATTRRHDAALLSADAGFDGVTRLRRVDPSHPRLIEELAAL